MQKHPGHSPEHPTLSTQFLLSVRRMDPAGWSRLVTTFGPIVYRWCRTSGVHNADAPDLVQEVFAAVARGITSFEREKSQGSFRSWLATITRNKVRDYFRMLNNRQVGQGGTEALIQLHRVAEEPGVRENPTSGDGGYACENLDSTICAQTAMRPLIRELLQQVESEFESSTWKAFWMTTIDEVKASEAADQLGISVASVYQSKSRVLRRLRQRLAELPE